jgi:hypothetical protein
MRRMQRRVLLRMTSLRIRHPSLLLLHPVLPPNPATRRAKSGEGREARCGSAPLLLRNRVFEVSEFQQVPHRAITPHCSLLNAVPPEQSNSMSPFLSFLAVLATSLSCGSGPSAVIILFPLHPLPPYTSSSRAVQSVASKSELSQSSKFFYFPLSHSSNTIIQSFLHSHSHSGG